MVKKKSNPWARLKYFYVLPLAAIAVAAFARPEVSSELNEISKVKVSDFVADVKANGEKKMSEIAKTVVPQEPVKGDVFTVVENPPQYPGGMKELMTFLGKNIQYPAEAHKNNIEGRVIVQFVVTKDGSVSDFKVIRSVHPLLDAEALRVLSTMSKWTPGTQKGQPVNVKYIVPVGFKLQGAKEKAAEKDLEALRQKMHENDSDFSIDCVVKDIQQFIAFVTKATGGTQNATPLVLVDGEEVAGDSEFLKDLKNENIEKIQIKTNAALTAQYGEMAKNGVVLITTKNNKS